MYQPKPLYKLLDWIEINKLHWDGLYGLSSNPNAIHLLEKNTDKINWSGFFDKPDQLILRLSFSNK